MLAMEFIMVEAMLDAMLEPMNDWAAANDEGDLFRDWTEGGVTCCDWYCLCGVDAVFARDGIGFCEVSLKLL